MLHIISFVQNVHSRTALIAGKTAAPKAVNGSLSYCYFGLDEGIISCSRSRYRSELVWSELAEHWYDILAHHGIVRLAN